MSTTSHQTNSMACQPKLTSIRGTTPPGIGSSSKITCQGLPNHDAQPTARSLDSFSAQYNVTSDITRRFRRACADVLLRDGSIEGVKLPNNSKNCRSSEGISRRKAIDLHCKEFHEELRSKVVEKTRIQVSMQGKVLVEDKAAQSSSGTGPRPAPSLSIRQVFRPG